MPSMDRDDILVQGTLERALIPARIDIYGLHLSQAEFTHFFESRVLTLDWHPRIRVLANALRWSAFGVTTTYPQELSF